MTDHEAGKIVAQLAVAFPVPAWDGETLRLYRAHLTDVAYGDAQTAVGAMVKSRLSDHRPTVAEIRDAVRASMAAAGAIPTDLEPDEAWGFVQRCFGSVGSYRPFPVTHPLVAVVVERMGWTTLCASDNPEANRPHFLRLYEAELKRQRHDRLTQRALCLPADAERLALPPVPVRRQLEPPASAEHVRSILGAVMATLPVPVAPIAEPAPDEPERIGDARTIAQRDVRRTQLRAQAERMRGAA